MPRSSIIVLNYNGRHFLEGCIDSLLAQTDRDFEILLVDNGSKDGSIAFLRARYGGLIRKKKVRLLQNRENTGFTGGNNKGVAAAKGKYVVLLNNDTVVFPDWLETLIDSLEKNPRALLVTAMNTAPDDFAKGEKSRLNRFGGECNPLWQAIHRSPTNTERKTGLFHPYYLGGASLAFRRKDFPEPFDNTYFAYAEDIYLSMRARLRGGDLVADVRAQYRHFEEGTKKSSPQLSALSTFHGTKNEIINMLIFYEAKNVLRLFPLFILYHTGKAMHQPHSLPLMCKAWFWTLRHPRTILEKRRMMQAERKVPDAQILTLTTCEFFDERSTTISGLERALVWFLNRASCAYLHLVGLKTKERTQDHGSSSSR